jgi:aromatic ring hydroxylase
LRLLNTISDLTARDFGGYHAVLAVHAEGSIEAEKMQIYRAYEPGRAIAYAKQLAGLD